MTNLPITGFVHVTGDGDGGKSTFCLECGAQPKEIAFIDDDIKGRSVAKAMVKQGTEFGMYRDLREEAGKLSQLQLHDYGLELIDSIESGRFKVIIWDTWSRFERTFHPYVLEHPKEFRKQYAGLGTIKGGQQWKDSFEYEAAILGSLTKKAPLVFIVTHLKKHYVENKAVPGRLVPDCKEPVARGAIMRLWLLKTVEGPPTGLLLKRIDRKIVTEKGIRTTMILPPKIVPCTWDRVLEYIANPVGNRKLKPNETPEGYEVDIIKGTLSADQREDWRIAMLYGSKEEEASAELSNASREPTETDQRRNQIAALLGAGKSEAEVMEETGASLLEVLQVKGELE